VSHPTLQTKIIQDKEIKGGYHEKTGDIAEGYADIMGEGLEDYAK
jgi:hypothetical protein